MLFADKGSFSYQLGWKSPGDTNERSHFRCSFSHPLLPILNHTPEWQVFWECSIGPTDSFSHLKTKPKQVAPKSLLRNAFCVTHHLSWMEISFSISQSLVVFLFVFILLSFPNYIHDSTAHGIIHVVSNLKGPKISTDPTNTFHSWQVIPLETIISCKVGTLPQVIKQYSSLVLGSLPGLGRISFLTARSALSRLFEWQNERTISIMFTHSLYRGSLSWQTSGWPNNHFTLKMWPQSISILLFKWGR